MRNITGLGIILNHKLDLKKKRATVPDAIGFGQDLSLYQGLGLGQG